MGSCTLDLRKALIHGNEIVIKAYVVMGAVKIIVPPGINVELEGFTILGSRESKIDDEDALPGAPTVRVQGLTVMGAVNIVGDDRPDPAEITALFDKSAASTGYYFYFDYLWPLEPQDVPDAPQSSRPADAPAT